VAAADVVLGGINTATAETTIRNTQTTSTAKALIGLVTTTGAGQSTAGVQGQSNATNGNGLFGVALSGAGAKGAWGRSANGTGVYGEATATSGTNYGVRGTTGSPGGIGVHGQNTGSDGTGILGVSNSGGNAIGVHGRPTDGMVCSARRPAMPAACLARPPPGMASTDLPRHRPGFRSGPTASRTPMPDTA
jgi:hypothetical protein